MSRISSRNASFSELPPSPDVGDESKGVRDRSSSAPERLGGQSSGVPERLILDQPEDRSVQGRPKSMLKGVMLKAKHAYWDVLNLKDKAVFPIKHWIWKTRC